MTLLNATPAARRSHDPRPAWNGTFGSVPVSYRGFPVGAFEQREAPPEEPHGRAEG